MTEQETQPERRWWRLITDHWGYKLAALFLVTILWINVTADERQPTAIRTLLEIEVLDSAWVLVSGPPVVRTTFQGPNREMMMLLADPPVIRQVIDSVTSPNLRLALSGSQVVYDRSLSVRPLSVEPATVDLEFEPRGSRMVPVLPLVEATAAMGFTVVRPFRSEPDSVLIRGAESAIESIRSLATRRILLTDLEHTVVRDLPLALPSSLSSPLEVEPPSVLVTAVVDSLVERRVTVPIRITGAAQDDVSAGISTTVAVIRGASAAVTAQASRISEAVILVDSVPEGRMPYTIEAPPTDAQSVTISFEPAEVMVSPGRDG
ncbi:MAG: CdaR family protein [Gemmatimonadota bacterium]